MYLYPGSQYKQPWVDIKNPNFESCYSRAECDGHFEDSNSNAVGTAHFPSDIAFYVGPTNLGTEYCLRFGFTGQETYFKSVGNGQTLYPICEADCGGEEGWGVGENGHI